MKWIRMVLAVAAVCLTVTAYGCRGKGELRSGDAPLRMVVLLPGTIEDQSWNNSNYQGILACRKALGVDLKCVTDVQEVDFQMVLKEYASQGYGLIMASGSQFDDAVSAVASSYPSTTFCVINGSYCGKRNVAPVFLKEYEASYLAAIIAGNVTKNGTFGIIAGYPNGPMENLLDVYEKYAEETAKKRGIRHPKALRSYTNSWTDTRLAQKIAQQMIDSGADTLFVYANQAGLGCVWAARESGVKVIGFSDDQNELGGDTVAASIDFDFGTLYNWIVQKYLSGDLKGGRIHKVGMKEGIFLPVYPKGAPDQLKEAVEEGRRDFLAGKVKLKEKEE